MIPITPRQTKALDFIRSYSIELGYPPTLQELADSLGIAKVGAFEHVKALEKKGYVIHDGKGARSYRLAVDPTPEGELRNLRGLLAVAIVELRKAGQPGVAERIWGAMKGRAVA